MFNCFKSKLLTLLALLAAVIAAICTASIIYMYKIPIIGPDNHDQFLGLSRGEWLLLRNMGYIIAGLIVLYLYHLYTTRRFKKMEDKFSNYLKDLDELNEEWADENHELWEFIESILKEKDIKKIKRKAKSLLKSRNTRNKPKNT